jgi:hypothetical protein
MSFSHQVHCSHCHQPIADGPGFISFKVPGNEGYHFFHCRFRGGDCWEAYLKAGVFV